MPRKENDQLSAFLDRLLNINPVGGLGGSVIETSDLSVKERETLEGLIEWGSVRQVMSGIYVHVWRDEADRTWIGYNDPRWLAARCPMPLPNWPIWPNIAPRRKMPPRKWSVRLASRRPRCCWRERMDNNSMPL